MFVNNISHSCSSFVFQKQNTKLVVFCANLLGNIYSSASPSESDELYQGQVLTYRNDDFQIAIGIQIRSCKCLPVPGSEDELVSSKCGLRMGTVCCCCAGKVATV